MLDFEFKNPTKIIFGKGKIKNIAKEIPANSKVLLNEGSLEEKATAAIQKTEECFHSMEIKTNCLIIQKATRVPLLL